MIQIIKAFLIEMEMEKIAQYAFMLFVLLAIVTGLVVGYMAYNNDANYATTKAYVTLVMLLLGILIGIVSITGKEVMPFIIATIALVVASSANVWQPLETIHPLLSDWATGILDFIVAFAAPAAVINAIKTVFAMAREK
jgi:F0F1-type ATP synthase assembly protein I